jgi:carboxypeptidase C (cathepsin A)
VHPWSYKRFENDYVDASDTLRKAMSKNPFLKVFVASGYYDLATPYFATDHTFSQMALDPSLRKNIDVRYYAGGHMMYVHEPSLKKLRHDLERFYTSSVKAKKD